MPMSWTTALKAQDDNLESLLARRQLQQNQMLDAAQTLESQRHSRVAEDHSARQLDEQTRLREANQRTLDEQRAAMAADKMADVELAKRQAAKLESVLADPNATPEEKQAARFMQMGIKPAAGIQTGNDADAMAERARAVADAAAARSNNTIAGAMARALLRQDGIQDDGPKGGGRGAASNPVKARKEALEVAEEEDRLGALPNGMTVAERADELVAESAGTPRPRAGRDAPATSTGQDMELGAEPAPAPAGKKPALVVKPGAQQTKAIAILKANNMPTDPASVATFIAKNKDKL